MTHHRTFRASGGLLAVLAGAALALAACSSSGSTVATTAATVAPTAAPVATDAPAPTDAPATTDTLPPAPDPCSLVSQTQAQQIVGVTMQAPVEAGTPDDRMCQYVSDPTGPTAQVEAFTGAGAKKMLDTDKDTLQHDFTTLAGVGDEAYLEADNVFVRKGSTWVAVNVVALDAPADQVQTALTALASTIAGEL